MSGPDIPLPAWQEFVSRHAAGGVPDGSVLDGVVVKVVPFGAFVELTDGIHGLLHESECAPPEVGTQISVRIKAFDVERRRMSLEPA